MRTAQALTPGDHRDLTVAVVIGVLALPGLACIGVAVTHQQNPPAPLPAVQSPGPPAGPLSPSWRPPPATAAPQVVGPVLPASAPLALAIPAIGVKSPLLHLGQTAEGALEVPAPGPHYNDAGWYRYSPTPGSLGPAIIVGHLDSAQAPSVFFRLGDLRRHDTVLITRTDGSVVIFAVDDVRRYPKERFPSQLIYGNTDHAALRLITCGGAFDDRGHHPDNIVVLASLVHGSGAAQPTSGPRTAG
jgi:sortase (surface protein transpeptidase)